MDFARKELEKYGWRDGKGLGKGEDGISTPLKPKLKFDNTGVGHNPGSDFTNKWWEDLYNRAAKNLDVKVDKDGDVKLELKSGKPTEVTTSSYSISEMIQNNNLEYGSFLKTSRLTEAGVEHYQIDFKETHKNKASHFPDHETFKACGGRTMNPAARFGINMSGKLSRLERQEKMLLKKMKNVSLTDAPQIEKKVKKLKKSKKSPDTIETQREDTIASPIRKKKKKKKRSVSFNETVTEYYPPADINSESSQKNENESEIENNESVLFELCPSNTQDEGIEIDIADKQDKPVVKFDDLSKAERKKLKKKRDSRATAKFLAELNIDTPDTSEENDIHSRCRKRKLTFDDEGEDSCIAKFEVTQTEALIKLKKKNKKKERGLVLEVPVESQPVHKDKKKKKHKDKKGRNGKQKTEVLKSENQQTEDKQLNMIMQSLDVCKISDAE